MSSGTRHEQVSQTFFLDDARKSPNREWTKAQAQGKSEGFECREPTGRVIIVIAVVEQSTPNRAEACAALQGSNPTVQCN